MLEKAPELPGQPINTSTQGASAGGWEGTPGGEGIIYRVTFPARVKSRPFTREPSRGLPRADPLQPNCVCSDCIPQPASSVAGL